MKTEQSLDLPNLDATVHFASSLARSIVPGAVIFLIGPLGAGKTTLVRAILQHLGFSGAIKSPTYTLVETYTVGVFTIHHFDLYRLAHPSELEFIGIRDYVEGDAICIFEWPEKGAGYVPRPDLEIVLSESKSMRHADVTAKTDTGEKILQACMRPS